VSEFHALVLASHPPIRAFFADAGRQDEDGARVTVLALDSRAVAAARDLLATASVAAVDASVDPGEALAVCKAIRADHPTVAITAVFCCPHSATATTLRALLAAGVDGLLDLQLSATDTLHVLRGVARGGGTLHLQLAAGSGSSLLELLAGEQQATQLSDDDVGLLRLITLGHTDHEIGRQLYLSHHTIKHRIDRLRRRVHAKNRIQLAAWAGAQPALSSTLADATSAERDHAAKVPTHPYGPAR
jgi:two-component system, NarL family, response regulator DevR